MAVVRASDAIEIEFEVAGSAPEDTPHAAHADRIARHYQELSKSREIGEGARHQLLAFLRTTRPLSSLVAGVMSASIPIATQGRLSLMSVAAGLAMTVLAMFGFVINDVFDYSKDAAAGVRRPIAAAEISIREAVILAAGLLVSVFLLSRIVGTGGKILAITSLGLVAYSILSQRYPLGKGVYVAGICCAPLFYGSAVGGLQCSWFSYATLACFVFGRETLMDAEELVGDRLAGLRTIAVMLGGRRTRRLGAIVMLLSTVGLVAASRTSSGRIAAAAMLLCLICLFLWPGLSDATRIKLSRIPMLFGAAAIAMGGR